MGNSSNSRHIENNEKQKKYDCLICREQNLIPKYYTTRSVKVEVANGIILGKCRVRRNSRGHITKEYDLKPKYNEYGDQINKKTYVKIVKCSNNHETLDSEYYVAKGADIYDSD